MQKLQETLHIHDDQLTLQGRGASGLAHCVAQT